MNIIRDLWKNRFRKRVLTEGVAVALGSGGLKGFFHIGVLQALDESGIPVRMIAGTSAGAIAGCAYAAGIPIKEIIDFAAHINMGSIFTLGNPVLPKSGLLKASSVIDFLRKNIKPNHFIEMKIPLYIIATDIMTGEAVVLHEGDVPLAVRASVSVPAVFEPVIINNRILVDGGITENLPVHTLRQHWKGLIFASSLTAPLSPPSDILIKHSRKPLIHFIKSLPVFNSVPWLEDTEFQSVESHWAAILLRAWDIMAYENYSVKIKQFPPDMLVTVDSECNPGLDELNEESILKIIARGKEKTLICLKEAGVL
jgi:predicted acylesterase/phospholipase RssA